MPRFIALYRGINVGGNNPVKMDALRAMHESFGHTNVRSYIQSGNLVFEARGTAPSIAKATAAQFAKDFGFSAHILIVDSKAWTTLVAENHFAKAATENPKLVHAGICDGKPSNAGLTALKEKTRGPEAFVIKGTTIYLHAPDGVGNSKFAAGIEKAAGVSITMRNWRTIEALAAMLQVTGT